MVITLTTGIVFAVCGSLTAFGVGKGVKAAIDNKKANAVNDSAKKMINSAKRKAEIARKASKTALEILGATKMKVYSREMKSFAGAFGKIKNFRFSDVKGLDDLAKFKVDKMTTMKIQDIQLSLMSMAGGAAGGAALGSALAFGAFGGVGMFAAASTGTAIASLSGVAATNATLAWLGGGALAAGGGGMAAGAVVLGGIVAGPALAVFGFVVGAQAAKKLNQAYGNLAKAKKISVQLDLAKTACEAITEKAKHFSSLLEKARKLFRPQLERLEEIVSAGDDYACYSEAEQKDVCQAVSTVQILKALLDTPLLTKDGKLDHECEVVGAAVSKQLMSV